MLVRIPLEASLFAMPDTIFFVIVDDKEKLRLAQAHSRFEGR